jgi:co-chaperonin GroES (HSP10)
MQTTVAFIPNGLRYLVLPDPIEEKSETIAGVRIVEQVQSHKKSSSGRVMAVGDGTKKYQVGTRLLYGQYSGYAQELGGVEYIVLAESEILGELPEVPAL